MKPLPTLLAELKVSYAELCKCNASVVPSLLNDITSNLQRIVLQANLLPKSYCLAGCKTFYPKHEKLKTPDIELCDIIILSQDLNNERDLELFPGCVYVNICEDGKFYVGYTQKDNNIDVFELAKRRLDQHRDNGGGTYWTYFYPVISCIFAFPGSNEDEDLMTMLLARCVGITKVRGGRWASALTIPSLPKITAKEAISKLVSRNKTTLRT